MTERALLERKALAALERDRLRCTPKKTGVLEYTRACSFFINRFCYTFNPKSEPYHFRFKLFPFQEDLVAEFVRCIVEGDDVFIEKCREMGATYTTVCILLWFWEFVPGSNFLVGSRNEKFVDNTKQGSEGTNKEESIFGKFEYVLNRIMPQALPAKFDATKHLLFMSLVNPENGNVISGESSNANFSRGGRQKAILLDEFAFWENDSAAWGSTADTTDCRIVLTTPGIRPSKAKRLRFGDDGEKIKVISLPHSLDPRKDANWVDRQRERRSREDFSREIMLDWQGSLTGIVYPEIGYSVHGDYPYEPKWPLYASWDFGLDGVSIIWCQTNPHSGKLRILDYYENRDKTIDFYYPMIGKDIVTRNVDFYTADDITAIRELRRLKEPIHFGDPDVAKRSILTGTSTRSELAGVGIHVQTNRASNDFPTRREQTKIVLQQGIEINDTKRTARWVSCMENSRYPERSDNSQATTAIALPIHNWTSHGRTAFEYYCVNVKDAASSWKGSIINANRNTKIPTTPGWTVRDSGETVPKDILEQTIKAMQKKR